MHPTIACATAQVPGSGAKLIFAGIALVLAGGEAVLLGAKKPPEEPTRSLFAALVVIAAPKTLGELRKHYHKQLETVLEGELSKDLVGRPVADVEAAFLHH